MLRLARAWLGILQAHIPGWRGTSPLVVPSNICVYPGVKGGCVDASEDFVGSCLQTHKTDDGLSHAIGSSLFDFCGI